MRDGVRLFTRVYAPKDDSHPWPIVLTRTPYALKPYGTDNYNDPAGSFRTLAKDTFILVSQDVRGRYGSEGEYVHVRPFNPNKGAKDTDESSDTWDTIDWLVKNVPNNNGKAGIFGISYPGFYSAMGMIDSHPALKAASPQAPISDWFMGDDLFRPLEIFRATERMNPGITNLLVMGPWSHGEWGRGTGEKLGQISFHAKTAEFYREKIELPFFRQFLKGGDTNYTGAKAHIFETGTHQWRRFQAWPPSQAVSRTLYFSPGGRLAFDPPGGGPEAFDEYLSDPAKPVPYTAEPSTGYPRSYPLEDQRFAATRPDVLVYETEPLDEDLTLAGPLQATLHVSTTGTDADWVVKLVDVYPGDFPNPDPNPAGVKLGGYQQLVRGDDFRGKFRNSFQQPDPFEPGKVTKIEFTMPDVCHCFRRGHRVVVQVQSSWFPLVDRNPQTFVNIPTAKPDDFRKATHRIYRAAHAPSGLVVQVLSGGAHL